MSTYYLVRKSDGFFVANVAANPTGSSFTKDLRVAKQYPSREVANKDRCWNERVTTLEEVAGEP